MILFNMKGEQVSTCHSIIISNKDKTRFIRTHPKLCWTDNLNFARVIDSLEEFEDFTSHPLVRELAKDNGMIAIWSDTKEELINTTK